MAECKTTPIWVIQLKDGNIVTCSEHLGFVMEACVQAGKGAGLSVGYLTDAGGHPCCGKPEIGVGVSLKAKGMIAGVTPGDAPTVEPKKQPTIGVKPSISVK